MTPASEQRLTSSCPATSSSQKLSSQQHRIRLRPSHPLRRQCDDPPIPDGSGPETIDLSSTSASSSSPSAKPPDPCSKFCSIG